MKAGLHQGFRILRDTVDHWVRGEAFTQAGALAFFTLFSVAPVVILAVHVIGLVLSADAVMAGMLEQLEGAIGAEAASAVQGAVARTQIDQSGWLPMLIGAGAMLVGATTVFAQLQQSLNNIWSVAPRPSRSTLFSLIKSRLMSLTIVLVIGFVMLVSMLLNVLLGALRVFAADWLPVSAEVMVAAESLASLLVITLLFAAMFRVLPDVRLRWREVLPGALLTALLFMLGRFLIALYLSQTATASTYGAAGSLVLLLLWVYYSSLILLFGAAFTRAYTEARGFPVQPTGTAVCVRRLLEEESSAEAGRGDTEKVRQ